MNVSGARVRDMTGTAVENAPAKVKNVPTTHQTNEGQMKDIE